jgi:hypothetical protein
VHKRLFFLVDRQAKIDEPSPSTFGAIRGPAPTCHPAQAIQVCYSVDGVLFWNICISCRIYCCEHDFGDLALSIIRKDSIMIYLITFLLSFATVLHAAPPRQHDSPTRCKCTPADICWPNRDLWSTLNDTVDGQLIKTVPLGTPCHAPNYDRAACEILQRQWDYAPIQ